MEADYVDGPHRPFAEIEFRYRSAAALKSLAIIPRTPSPEPPKPDLSRDEVNKIHVSLSRCIHVDKNSQNITAEARRGPDTQARSPR
jgi:hypothetical protein